MCLVSDGNETERKRDKEIEGARKVEQKDGYLNI